MAESFELKIRSSSGGYTVRIGDGEFDQVLQGQTDLVLADPFFGDRFTDAAVRVVWVAAVEEQKTLTRAERLILACRDAGARRGSRLLAVGGGVVQDLATLVASLYMRGLPWVYAPTTLMAVAESCIGGKSAISAGNVKNLVGNIYPPEAVVVDPSFIATLAPEGVAAGLSEAVKICFCRGPGS